MTINIYWLRSLIFGASNVTSLRMTDAMWTTLAKQTNGAPYTNTLKRPFVLHKVRSFRQARRYKSVRLGSLVTSRWSITFSLWRSALKFDNGGNKATWVGGGRGGEEGRGSAQTVCGPAVWSVAAAVSPLYKNSSHSREEPESVGLNHWITAPLNTPLRPGSALVFYLPLNSFHS